MENDAHTEERKAWLYLEQMLQCPLCYRRDCNGVPVWSYTPAAQQGEDYLRQKFARMRGGISSLQLREGA